MIKIKKLPSYLYFPLLLVSVVTLFFFLQKTIWPEFLYNGIHPRSLTGLKGIILANLIHHDLSHWFNNSVSFLIMSGFLFYFHKDKAWKIIIWGSLLTGLLTWLIGRPNLHIGLSGLNYVLFSYLVITGFLSKHPGLSAISLILIFIYGGLIWLMFPLIKNISWEAHLSGFLVGAFFTGLYLKDVKRKYRLENKFLVSQEDNDFILCFDESGNFIENNSSEDEMIKNR